MFNLALTFGLDDDPLQALELTVGLIEETVHPDNPRFQRLSPDDRLIVSEPFSNLSGVWQEIPQRTAVTVQRGGGLNERPFSPRTPG